MDEAKNTCIHAQYQTDEINHLAGALSKAQGAYKKLVPNQIYKGDKFANLNAIFEATREATSANGLSFMQRDEILGDGTGTVIFKSMLLHESGQWISSWSRIIPERTERETAVIYEYRARQHAVRLLGIAPSYNDPYLFDDNGEHQSERRLVEDLQKPREELMRDHDGIRKTIDDRQYRALMNEIGEDKVTLKEIQDKQGISTIADLPEDAYLKTLSWVRRVNIEAKNELSRKKR